MPQERKYNTSAERQAAYRERQRQQQAGYHNVSIAVPLDESERELALEVIAAGYKVLSAKLHPDMGGSHEAMVRLNRVRDILKQQV